MNLPIGRRSAIVALFLPLLLGASAPVPESPLRAVLVGGGPNPNFNQVAIESNVRWVDSLLPNAFQRTILFCDGRSDSAVVQYARQPGAAEAGMGVLFPAPPDTHGDDARIRYRPTELKKIDGPTTQDGFQAAVGSLASDSGPVLLYFTGHGSPNRRDPSGNRYDLWRGGGITPASLASQIARLPEKTPVTILMVQCFSGAFGNILFENADPAAPLVSRPICGFFAATQEREAAGCTPEVNEAEYRDFTSSFFAGLTGTDRVGRKVSKADYNRDGKTGFDEAYAYALIHDPSIDVPVATSDVFLRRFVPVADDSEITEVPWDKIYSTASPAQRAALDGLCNALGPRAQTPDRVRTALDEFRRRVRQGDAGPRVSSELSRDLGEWRRTLTGLFPGLKLPLRNNTSADPETAKADRALYVADYRRAIDWIDAHPAERDRLVEVRKKVDAMQAEVAEDAIAGARWLRLLRLSKSIVLEMRLREKGDKALLARFDALKALEAQNPLTG